MELLPKYGDKTNPIYSVIIINTLTLGLSGIISLFYLKDIILSSLFFIQIIFANYNQGFINGIYLLKWRIADIIGALIISIYGLIKFYNTIPFLLCVPLNLILMISCYFQSITNEINKYIIYVNLWHFLVLNYIIILTYFYLTISI